jgi:multiple sugar transport system substrate-binding protein
MHPTESLQRRTRGGARGRRDFLRLAGGLGAAAGLSACSFRTDPGAEAMGPTAKLEIPGPKLAGLTGNVTLRWMDSGDLKAPYETAAFTAYSAKNPQVKISYDGTSWDRIDETIPLGVRNASAPDVFAMPDNVPLNVGITNGWIAPIDDLVPDFVNWVKAFPPTAFIPGVHIFDGKTYGWPLSSSKRATSLLFYDTEYMKQVGVDPQTDRLTWSGFRAVCKKLTEQGNGDYFGLLTNGLQLAGIACALAEVAGLPHAGDIDYRTGEYTFTDPRLEAAIEMLLAVKSDGSFYPGYVSLADATSRARMPQRVAGVIFDSVVDIGVWALTAPDYKYDLAMPPMPDDKVAHTMAFQELGANSPYVYAKSKHKQIAGDLFAFMGSPAGQRAMVEVTKGNLVSEMPAANAAAQASSLLDPRAKRAAAYSDKLLRVAPLPQVRNPDTARALLALQPVEPTLKTVVQGIFTGQVKNIKKALKSLQDSNDRALDNAVRTAVKQGAKVSRDDWKFPNWVPGRNYTAADYTAVTR